MGGLAGTLREDGCGLDLGPHSFFSDDTEIQDLVLGLFENELLPRRRRAKFYYQGRYLDYPLTTSGVLFQMGAWQGLRAGASFAASKIGRRKRAGPEAAGQTVEDWAIGKFGSHLYRSFFKPYTEQLWEVPCAELSTRTIPSHTRMGFLNTLRALVQRSVPTTGASLIEREKLPTYYPETGFGEIADRIADRVRFLGGRIRLGHRVTEVVDVGHHRMLVRSRSERGVEETECSLVVSTIPLHPFAAMLRPAPPREVLSSAERLDHRALLVLGIVNAKQDVLDSDYIYLLNRPYNRVSETNRFSPATSPPGENMLMLEIPCFEGSELWKASKEDLFDRCAPSLAEDGLLEAGADVRLMLHKSPHAYPVYRKDYAPHLNRVLGYLEKRRGVCTLGRNGEFMYMDIDRCIRRAFSCGEVLLRSQLGDGAVA